MAKRALVDKIITEFRDGEKSLLVIIAVPSHDDQNKPIPHQKVWTQKAMELFADLYGGATAMQTLKGVYRSQDGRNLWDKPILVESYTDADSIEDPKRLEKLVSFCRRMRKALRQEAIMVVIDDSLHFVKR